MTVKPVILSPPEAAIGGSWFKAILGKNFMRHHFKQWWCAPATPATQGSTNRRIMD
jgi:hypothetical protein